MCSTPTLPHLLIAPLAQARFPPGTAGPRSLLGASQHLPSPILAGCTRQALAAALHTLCRPTFPYVGTARPQSTPDRSVGRTLPYLPIATLAQARFLPGTERGREASVKTQKISHLQLLSASRVRPSRPHSRGLGRATFPSVNTARAALTPDPRRHDHARRQTWPRRRSAAPPFHPSRSHAIPQKRPPQGRRIIANLWSTQVAQGCAKTSRISGPLRGPGTEQHSSARYTAPALD